jgi:hypothetical protein
MSSHAILIRNTADFQSFVNRVQHDTADVHSLSITTEPEWLVGLHNDDPLNASESTQQLWRLLEEFGSILPSLDHLHSFNFLVLGRTNNFWIPRPLLATFLSKLPTTCTSLEIDTSGSDRAEPGTSHLCDTIREILPRLQHFRLDLSTLCPKAFETTTPCPTLTTLTISCFAGNHNSRLCNPYTSDPVPSAFTPGKEAMPHLIHQLQTILPLLPNLNQCLVLDQNGNPSTNSAFHLTYNRRDLLRNTVTAMPVEYVHPFADDRDGYMLRMPEADVLGSLRALRNAVEKGGGGGVDGSAVDSVGGTLSSHEAEEEDPEAPTHQQVLSAEAWKAKYPRRGSRLWSSDRRAGKKVVEARVVAGAASRVRVPVHLGPEDEGTIVLRDYDTEEW